MLSALLLLADIAWHSLQLIGGQMINEIITHAESQNEEQNVVQAVYFMLQVECMVKSRADNPVLSCQPE